MVSRENPQELSFFSWLQKIIDSRKDDISLNLVLSHKPTEFKKIHGWDEWCFFSVNTLLRNGIKTPPSGGSPEEPQILKIAELDPGWKYCGIWNIPQIF